MTTISPLELDALTEIVNIGVGRAANSLSDIIGNYIQLKIPHVDILPLEQLPNVLNNFKEDQYSLVLQSFQGDFAGSSALVFPPDSAQRLVSALTGGDTSSLKMDLIRSGTLIEIGNIVMNAILGTMGNLLDCTFVFSLPEFREIKELNEIVEKEGLNQDKGFILLAEANFNISSLQIQGFIFIIFKLDSIAALIKMIQKSMHTSTKKT